MKLHGFADGVAELESAFSDLLYRNFFGGQVLVLVG